MYGIGDIVDSEKERNERLSRKSDGKFASDVRWVVVDDHVGITWNNEIEGDVPGNPRDGLMNIPRVDGDNVFDSIRSNNFFSDVGPAEKSAYAYNLRYTYSDRSSKEWFRIRYKERNGRSFMETGSNTPLRVKTIAIPFDAIAEECENYSEYKLKCELKGLKPGLSEQEFAIYKY